MFLRMRRVSFNMGSRMNKSTSIFRWARYSQVAGSTIQRRITLAHFINSSALRLIWARTCIRSNEKHTTFWTIWVIAEACTTPYSSSAKRFCRPSHHINWARPCLRISFASKRQKSWLIIKTGLSRWTFIVADQSPQRWRIRLDLRTAWRKISGRRRG